MLHAGMAAVTVRVVPRSGKTSVEAGPDGIRVRVRAAPEGGRATEEARRAVASALGLSPSAVRLVRGARSRTKVFDVEGLTADDLRVRLGAT
ncbi:MAG TPA: DUF167 domain-containing protein [Actinomycetota bacterium]|nr:DUF167 domain-containing protein [Actinomycetota bacterium]